MARITYVFIILSYFSGALPAAADILQDTLFNGDYEFIDLSYTFNNNTIYWPGTKQFEFTKKTVLYDSDNSFLSALNDFAAGEHGGTHIDAPYHFYQPGQYVADLPMEKLIVPLIIIDVSSKVNGNSDYILFKKDVDYIDSNHFDKFCVVIFKFGWSQYFNDRQKYLGLNGTKLNFPGLSAEVAEWITSHKNIVGVGVDGPSVDPGAITDYPVHKILSKAGLYNMENVNLHRHVNEYNCTALVLPMKIGMGTGAPLRLVAICPKES